MLRWKLIGTNVFLSLFALLNSTVWAADVEASLKSRLITQINGSPCYRLISQNGDIGCSTGDGGSTGYLYLAVSAQDIAAFKSLESSPKRAVLMPPSLLTLPVLNDIGTLEQLAGVLVMGDPISYPFSPAAQQLPIGYTPTYNWNPQGRNLLATRFQFPIVALKQEETAQLLQQASSNKAKGYDSYPQYAANFRFYMGPKLTSEKCLGDKSCLPLGGQSVWASLGPIGNASFTSAARRASLEFPTQYMPNAQAKARAMLDSRVTADADVRAVEIGRRLQAALPQKSGDEYVMAVAQMDSNGLFHDIAFGADSAVSGLVALLAAADAVGRTNAASLPKKILFGAFQAEQFGRVGSRRWLQEITSFSCNKLVSAAQSPTGHAFCQSPLRTNVAFTQIQPSKISHVVAIDQLGKSGTNPLFAHETECRAAGSFTTQVLAALTGLPLPVQAASITNPPPSPLLSFAESTAACVDGTVITGYDAQFTTNVYHSQYDNASNVDAARVSAGATALAKLLYALATNETDAAAAAALVPASLAANSSFVAALLDCILVNPQCAYFQQILGVPPSSLAALFGTSAMSLYTGVYNQPYGVGDNGYVVQPTGLEAVVRNSLAYSTSVTTYAAPKCTQQTCQSSLGTAYECIMDKCVLASAYYHDALSPAISSSGYGQYSVDQNLVSAIDPVWTEPYWSAKIGADAFLMESRAVDIAILVVGIVVVLVSVPGVWLLISFLDKRYKVP